MSDRTSVPSRSMVTLCNVNGDLEVGRHATVRGSSSPPKVTVSGTVHCEGDDTFECSLSAESLEAEDNVIVHGDLEIRDKVEVEDGSLEVKGNMTATKADVDNTLCVSREPHS